MYKNGFVKFNRIYSSVHLFNMFAKTLCVTKERVKFKKRRLITIRRYDSSHMCRIQYRRAVATRKSGNTSY